MFWLVDTRELLAPDASASLGRSRGRVLELLRDSGAPLTTADVAQRCRMHPNTARFHLDALVEAGLAVRDPGRAHAAPGRPATGYRASANATASTLPGGRRYRLTADRLEVFPESGLCWVHLTIPGKDGSREQAR